MALIKCKHCGKQISDKATSCPKCGTPQTPVDFHPMHEVGKSNEKSNQHLSIQKTHENFETQVSRDNHSKKTLYLPIITLGAIAIGVIVWLAVTSLRTPKGLNENELNELQELKSRTIQIQERNAELQALRQDSIRKDSIAQEERMRLKPSYFKGCWVNEQTLKSIGFQKIREIREPDDEFDLEDYFVYYSRTLNGRRIDLECWETMGSGVNIEFHNKADKDQFVKELKKIAEQKSSNNYYISKYDYHFEVAGNYVIIRQF